MWPKAIIFDLDGTLIHSAPDMQSAVNAALMAIGRDTLDLPTVISFIGNGVEVLVARSLAATGGCDGALEKRVLALFLAHYAEHKTNLTRPYSGVQQALDGFRDLGVPMGVCTNKPAHAAQGICQELGLSPYFPVITGAQEGLPKKPHPALMLACIDTLGQNKDDVLFVGDSAVDYETAQNAGVAFRLFSGGYLNKELPSLSDADRFDDWHAHGIVLRD